MVSAADDRTLKVVVLAVIMYLFYKATLCILYRCGVWTLVTGWSLCSHIVMV